jgi:hypothetical protein
MTDEIHEHTSVRATSSQSAAPPTLVHVSETRVATVLVVAVAAVFALVLAVLPAIDTEDPRYGDVISGRRVGLSLAFVPLFESDEELERDLDAVADTGATWIRFDFYWAVLEPKEGEIRWELTDRVIREANERGLRVLGILTYTPKWARPRGTTDKAPPTDAADFARFARKAAHRYSHRGVHAWEVWNEPNTAAFWEPGADPEAYAELLEATYRAVHDEDPRAVVLTGGLAPVGDRLDYVSEDGAHMSPWRFLSEVYDAGGKGSFDAVAHHPYPPNPGGPAVSAPGNSFAQTVELHELMIEHGDGGKRVWGTEAGSWTGTSDGAVSEERQALLAGEMLDLWARWDFVGPFLYYSLRDLGTNDRDREDNFGLLRHDFREKEAFASFDAAIRDRG